MLGIQERNSAFKSEVVAQPQQMLEDNIKDIFQKDKGSYTAKEIIILLNYKDNENTFFRQLGNLVRNNTLERFRKDKLILYRLREE